jgi:glycine cleavage system H lipoate-binding protein
MTGFHYEDLFATKHFEYLLVIGFLALLVLFWRFMQKPAGNALQVARMPMPSLARWFELPQGFYYHQGHSWAMPEDGFIKVGVDDFAQKMIGHINAVDTPPVGSSVEQGRVGWTFNVDSKTIDMLSPVKGEIVEINRGVFENPELINQDPYGQGWLMRIRPPTTDANFKNLFTHALARVWTGMSVDTLMQRMGGEVGTVYQDGGTPVSGIARAIDPDDWDSLVKKFLLTNET